ncbi:hypothetical protein [Paenirhodobacter populi]|uniref:Uncharacterized protein n=1 Tax=Paenirhodobacter populi TaxID=2306993 RepID=A0A443J6G0_9RHOB|nr:hypothetical protein [Sinirhodobacter populi]RWR16073.1 hypothetical protein D2T30_22445 [Sinirhodobacter populi]
MTNPESARHRSAFSTQNSGGGVVVPRGEHAARCHPEEPLWLSVFTVSECGHHFEENKDFTTRNRPSNQIKLAITSKELERHSFKLGYRILRRISGAFSSLFSFSPQPVRVFHFFFLTGR